MTQQTFEVYIDEAIHPDKFLLLTALFLAQEEKVSVASELAQIRSVFQLQGNFHDARRRSPNRDQLIARMLQLIDSLELRPERVVIKLPQAAGGIRRAAEVAFPLLLRRVDAVLGREHATGAVFADDIPGRTWTPQFPHDRINSVSRVRFTDQPGFVLADFAAWAEYRRQRQELILDEYKDGLTKFQGWIREYPLLGAADPTGLGQQIIAAARKQQTITLTNSRWTRARLVKSPDVLDTAQMGPPPNELVKSEGRFNHVGMPVFYLASDANTCAAELLEPNESKLLWLQDYTVDEKRVLDLSVSPDQNGELNLGESQLLMAALVYSGLVEEKPDRDQVWKPEYYVPRYVADVARSLQTVDGIRYNSVRGTGHNLALFHYEQGVTPIGIPRVRTMTYAEPSKEIELPPWQRDLWPMPCVNCGAAISEQIRICPKCGKQNPFFSQDDDV